MIQTAQWIRRVGLCLAFASGLTGCSSVKSVVGGDASGVTVGTVTSSQILEAGLEPGQWVFNGVRKPGESTVTQQRTGAVLVFEIFETRLALSVAHSDPGCPEIGGFVVLDGVKLSVGEEFALAAVGCKQRVPAIEALSVRVM